MVVGTVRGRLLLSYIAILILLLAASLGAVAGTRQIRSQLSQIVDRDDALERLVVQHLTLLDDQETGVRGFLLTRDSRFLQPYRDAISRLQPLRKQSLRLIEGDPQLIHLSNVLSARSRRWQDWARLALRYPVPARSHALVQQQLEGKRRFDAYRRESQVLLRAVMKDRNQNLVESNLVADRLEALLGVLFVAAIIVVAIITRVMTRSVTEPLLRLSRSASAIGQGVLEEPVDVGGMREFTQLGESMEVMRRRLLSDRGSLQELTATLERRVEERTRQLQVSNTELESFSYSVSHDLRAPLRSIDGFSRALLEDFGGTLRPDARDYLARIQANAQRMRQLIDNLLRLSRVTQGTLELDTVDLSALAREILNELRRDDPQRDPKWIVQDGVTAVADERLIRPVLENLLGNSWKFTRQNPNPCIEFGMEDANGRVYYVRDNGAGFDMAYADRLFGAFQRLHGAAEFEGTGIGLATVQRVIHRHGGEIWADAEVGRGATFYFTLQPRAESTVTAG